MKTRHLILIISIGALAAFGGCERHSWEDTKRLHGGHGGDHEGTAADHEGGGHENESDTDHDKDAGEHAKTEKHSDPKVEKKESKKQTEKHEGKARKL